MKIVYDNIIFSLQRSGGISVVWYELLTRLQKSNQFEFLYLDDFVIDNPYRNQMQINENSVIGLCKQGFLSRYRNVDIKLNEPFIFHSSYYRYCTNPNAINITTVHDFTYEYFRKGLAKWVHNFQKHDAVRHSSAVVCISENTKCDLIKFFPETNEEKVHVIYNGVSEDYHVMEKKEPAPYSLKSNSYVVFVGDRSDYKNFYLCVNGIRHTEYKLVIVGKKLSKPEKKLISKYLPENQYFSTGYISNKVLNLLYNHAAALVYPSSYEGFGLPILEAQRAGCPVIAYKSSSIPEVIGHTPLLMSELTSDELIKKLMLLGDTKSMTKVKIDGYNNALRFSWSRMAGQYQKLYNLVGQQQLF